VWPCAASCLDLNFPATRSQRIQGFLAVRGSGYRRGLGHPLPNSFRQWCDAKGLPCVVVEQDPGGSNDDVVVVDLAPLRLLQPAAAREAVAAIAASAGARQLAASERLPDHVPFDILAPAPRPVAVVSQVGALTVPSS